jgi:hypothetical protein
VGAALRWRSERLGNRLQHAGSVPENVVVPEAQNAATLPSQPRIATLMVSRQRVLTTVRLNN